LEPTESKEKAPTPSDTSRMRVAAKQLPLSAPHPQVGSLSTQATSHTGEEGVAPVPGSPALEQVAGELRDCRQELVRCLEDLRAVQGELTGSGYDLEHVKIFHTTPASGQGGACVPGQRELSSTEDVATELASIATIVRGEVALMRKIDRGEHGSLEPGSVKGHRTVQGATRDFADPAAFPEHVAPAVVWSKADVEGDDLTAMRPQAENDALSGGKSASWEQGAPTFAGAPRITAHEHSKAQSETGLDRGGDGSASEEADMLSTASHVVEASSGEGKSAKFGAPGWTDSGSMKLVGGCPVVLTSPVLLDDLEHSD